MEDVKQQRIIDMKFKKDKGDNYEIFICNELNKDMLAWRWSYVPEYILLDAKLLNSQEEARLKRRNSKLKINPLIDDGIDIIAKDNTNYILVQCKDHEEMISKNHLITFYNKMDTFNQYEGRLYYTKRLCNTVKKYYNKNCINKNIKFIKYPYPIIEEEKEKLTLRNYQEEAVISLNNYFVENKRGILSMACGTGKTIVSIEFSKNYKDIIILSPLKAYAQQNIERFLNYESFVYLKINSSEERDIEEIIKFINNNKDKRKLFSATFKSVDIINKFIDLLENQIVIIDEFHNISKANIFDNNDEMNKLLNSHHKIMFMSATPRIYEIENEPYDTDLLFGKIVYSLQFSEAIKNGYITDYRISIPLIHDEISTILDTIKLEVNINKYSNNLSLKCIFLYKNILYYGLRKIIVYLRSHNEINIFIKLMNEINKYYCVDYNIDKIISHNKLTRRTKKLNIFSNNNYQIQILASVKILDECIDIPSCDSVYISYESTSKIRIIQRISRALRLQKNKIATIILWCNEYKKLYETISSIKEYDPILKEKINIISSKLESNNEEEIKKEKIKKEIEKKKIDKIVIGIKEYKSYEWHESLDQLKIFININKRIPEKNIDELRLYNWLYLNLHKYQKEEYLNIEHYNEFKKFKVEYDIKTNKEKEEENEKYYTNKIIEYIIKEKLVPPYKYYTKQTVNSYKSKKEYDLKLGKLYKKYINSNMSYNDTIVQYILEENKKNIIKLKKKIEDKKISKIQNKINKLKNIFIKYIDKDHNNKIKIINTLQEIISTAPTNISIFMEILNYIIDY
jgi:superfamily II DNA or RNA helicase